MKVSEFLKQLRYLSKDDLMSIKGIGNVLAQNYDDFLVSKRYDLLVSTFLIMEQEGLQMDVKKQIKNDEKVLSLSGQIICITGIFDISRDKIKTILEEKGARIIDTVSSSTTILLAGEKAGSKLDKAKKLDINIFYQIDQILQISVK